MSADPTVKVISTELAGDEVLETLSCGHSIAWSVRGGAVWSRADIRRCRICGEQNDNRHSAQRRGPGRVSATDLIDRRQRFGR